MPLCLGIDLTDDYIAIYEQGEETASVYPAVICREKKEDVWYIGEQAYRLALNGQGVMSDKLLKLLRKGGTSTIYHRSYTAGELVSKLLARVIEEKLRTDDFSAVDSVGVALHQPDHELMDRVRQCLCDAGIPQEKITMLTHEEAFIYYTLSRDKEIYSSMVALFDLSSESLSYYEFMMVRGVSRRTCVAEGEDIEEAFHTDILKKESGRTLGDKIITDVAKSRMEGRLFSAVILTGTGFDRTDWAQSFLSYVCRKRRVLVEQGLFAIGACMSGKEALEPEDDNACLIFCNSRIGAELSTEVTVGERKSRLILVPAGQRWYGLNVHFELIPHDQNYIDFQIEPFDTRSAKRVSRAVLEGFPSRPDRTTRIAVDLHFDRQDRADISIKDMGFGELYPASDRTVREEIGL